MDPAFDVDGLPNPFAVYWPAFITNLYAATIYVTALLVSPPAGWTDSEQNLVTISAGANARCEKSNSTRAVMATPHNETVTVRYNYRTGSYAGPIIGFDQFPWTIYWESISAGVIDDTDDFEDPINPGPPPTFDGWQKTNLAGIVDWARATTRIVHGVYACHLDLSVGEEARLDKSVTMGSGSRAYLFGFLVLAWSGTCAYRISIEGPLETLEIPYQASGVWRRFGIRLNPGVENAVSIYVRAPWSTPVGWGVVLDYLRWVRY